MLTEQFPVHDSHTTTHQPQVVFHLVHGTFNPGAPWTQQESSLRDYLFSETNGNCHFETPIWSGGNSHADRYHASIALVEDITRSFRQHPEAKHVIIGHSHGGNIALHSTQDSSIRDRLDGVITLSTPFFHCAARAGLFPLVGTAIFLIPFLLFAAIALGSATVAYDHIAAQGSTWILLFPAAMVSLAVTIGFKVYQEHGDRVAEYNAKAQPLIQQIQVPLCYTGPILTVQLLGDEVRIALGLQDMLAEWIKAMLHTILIFFYIGMLFIQPFAAGIALGVLVIASYPIFLFLTWFVRGHTLGFGEDNLAYYSLTRIWVSSWLPRRSNITRLRGFAGLRIAHSAAYANNAVLQGIGDWLRRNRIVR